MLAETLMALAMLAGNTVVAAATTDAWEAARHGFARLLGRGDPERTMVAERRLAETHEQLAGAVGGDLESARSALQAQWVTRLVDLLEEDPAVEADLRALVQEIQTSLPGRGDICGRSRRSSWAGCQHHRIWRRGGDRGSPRKRGAAGPFAAGSGSGLTEPGVASAGAHVIAGTSVVAQSGGVAVGHADHVTMTRSRVASQPVRLAPRPGFLAGREELLADLDALLSEGNGDGPRMAVLSGLGGAGKTSVAVEYAHRHLPEVGVAWQFAAWFDSNAVHNLVSTTYNIFGAISRGAARPFLGHFFETLNALGLRSSQNQFAGTAVS